MARSIADLELGLTAMAAYSDLDPWWVPAALNGDEVAKRVALCPAPEGLPVADEIVAELHECARKLEEAGWEVIETDCPPIREAMQLQLALWMSEYHLSGGQAVEREDDPDAKFVFARICEYATPPSLEQFMTTLQRRVAMVRDWQQFHSQYPVLLCPVSAELPFPDLLDIESTESFARVVEAQMLQIALPFVGIPALTVTTGQVGESPIGAQLVAGRFREDLLFEVAREIESRSPAITVADTD